MCFIRFFFYLLITGMERFMQSLYRTNGKPFLERLMGILHFFNAPPKQDDGDFTFLLEKKIVDELKELLQLVNFPETSMPSGYLHIKAWGNIFIIYREKNHGTK